MMAEMPPTMKSNSQSGAFPPSGGNTAFTSTTTTTTQPMARQGIAFDRALLLSIPGILSLVAIVFAFVAMVCIAASLPPHLTLLAFSLNNPAPFEFHLFTTIASWISLLIFTVVALLQVYRVVSIRGVVVKFIMIGHSAVWALFTLISSAVLLDYVNSHENLITNLNNVAIALQKKQHTLDIGGCRASGAFGILESFCLFGIVVILILDTLGIRRESDIFQ